MRVEFYESALGKSPIESFIDALPESDQDALWSTFEDIQQYGLRAAGCVFRHIKGKLWEIKTRTGGGSWRFFYVVPVAETMIVLHAYKKQGQKAPKRELKIAFKRLKETLG